MSHSASPLRSDRFAHRPASARYWPTSTHVQLLQAFGCDVEHGMRAWADWLGDRMTASPTIPRPTVEREFRLLLDVISEMVGPLRREVNSVWFHACEHYGRIASARGLAAGAVKG